MTNTIKSIKGRARHLGTNLKQMFRMRRFDNKVFGFAFSSTSKTSAGKQAEYLRSSGVRQVRMTHEGNQYIVWERYITKRK